MKGCSKNRNIAKKVALAFIIMLGIAGIVSAASSLVATSNLHIPHNGNVYSEYRKFSKDTQYLKYTWDNVEPEEPTNIYDSTQATLNVDLEKKTLLGLSSEVVKRVKLVTHTYSKSDTVEFENVGSGKYSFHHWTTRKNNASWGKFDANTVKIYTRG